jgi:hypothetical protein
MNKYAKIDVAVEEGDLNTTKRLILEDHICPSLYAIQMGMINKNYNTTNFALTMCHNKLRNEQDIKTVHYNYKTKQWSDCIPKEFRY